MSMLGLLQDISGATTEEQRLLATEAANQMRKNYGVYNTGSSESDYKHASSYGSTIDDLLDQINNYGSFSYDGQDSYQALLDSIVNQQPFSYDLQSDPSWGSYKKAYMREGDRASANALAQASAASGGRASSYALTAAQQAGNYYAGQLADIIPTLEQNAYARYLSDFSNRMSSLGAIENDRAFDYQNWMNEYNMLQNSLGNYQGQDATDYQRYLDTYVQQRQDEQDGKDTAISAPTEGAGSLLDDMMNDLKNNAQTENVDTSNFTVTNRNGNGWIAIGNSRMTWTELERAVNQGRIVEIIDPEKGTITYASTNDATTGHNPSEDNIPGDPGGSGGSGGGGGKNFVYDAMN